MPERTYHRIFQLDPLTSAIKTLMEAGYGQEVILGSLKIGEETFHKHLGYLYARVFDIASKNWMNNEEYNKVFIRAQEQWMNDRLRAVGYIFLNEVYDALGLDRSAQGQLVGWYRAPYSNVVKIDFIDDTEDGGFILGFNPDGIIYNKLSTF